MTQARFAPSARLLHWLMAILIIAMLFIGITMAATVSPAYATLVGIHKPLGIAILVLAVLRLLNRWRTRVPPLPADLPPIQRLAAKGSHYMLYALMLAMPLVGWGMLSAARYPIVLFGPVVLPPILPHDPMLYAWLRELHTVLAYLFFLVILAHLGAALFHGLIRRDGVLPSMASLKAGTEDGTR